MELTRQTATVAQPPLARLAGDQTPCAGEAATALDVGANTSTIAVSSPCTHAEPVQERCSVGRPGWPGEPWMLPQQRANCQASLRQSGTCGRRCARSHMRDLGRYAAGFQIAGFGPCLVQRRALLFVYRACCTHQLTCALMNARRGRRRPSRRDGAAGRQGGMMTRRLDMSAVRASPSCHRRRCDDPCAPRQNLPHVPDGDVGVSPRPPLAAQHIHSHPLGVQRVVERWSWAVDCGTGGVGHHGFVGEF